ncbi:unnamed protein product [Lepeophtheirus salmonis]|uniref:(salmon louse) hypothetical protein n=4 Tax=Lepeophtheirus salmonis TaxID=72036 RepID=A0A7R8H865_LEPSM|nr:unnamed protein product [Lepeophtheirus salmonis]CAF2936152.1 unnamed protein product [Lepeophtheirus salmonis]
MVQLKDIFNNFCEASSIHGIAYWHTKEPIWVRVLWTFVTLLGISSAAYMIRNNFISWESNPIIVSVWQVPIEESPFPGITICPLDDTRYASIELALNNANLKAVESDLLNLTQLVF